jgi:hypothetical protein
MGVLPLENLVHVDPDLLRTRLPEWQNLVSLRFFVRAPVQCALERVILNPPSTLNVFVEPRILVACPQTRLLPQHKQTLNIYALVRSPENAGSLTHSESVYCMEILQEASLQAQR